MSIAQGMGDVLSRSSEARRPGVWFRDSWLNHLDEGRNQAPQRVQVSTITVDSDPGNDVTGTVTINSVNVTFSTGTGLDAAGIAAVIKTAIDSAPLVRGSVIPTVSGAVVTLSGMWPGLAFTLTESESYLSTATTVSALTASLVPFGVAVITQGFRADGEPEKLVTLAEETAFVAQVQTLTVDTGQAVDFAVELWEIRGTERVLLGSDTVTGNATAATQATTIRNAINAIAPTNTVVATGASANIICTAEIAGLEFDLVVKEAGVSKVLTTGPSRATSLHRALEGISLYAEDQEATSVPGTEAAYRPNGGVRFAQTGELWVLCPDTVALGDTVYVELGVSNTGRLFGAAGADRVALSRDRATWLRNSLDAGSTLAAVKLT